MSRMMSAPLYSMLRKISVVMMRQGESGLMLTSPVKRPTCQSQAHELVLTGFSHILDRKESLEVRMQAQTSDIGFDTPDKKHRKMHRRLISESTTNVVFPNNI